MTSTYRSWEVRLREVLSFQSRRLLSGGHPNHSGAGPGVLSLEQKAILLTRISRIGNLCECSYPIRENYKKSLGLCVRNWRQRQNIYFFLFNFRVLSYCTKGTAGWLYNVLSHSVFENLKHLQCKIFIITLEV